MVFRMQRCRRDLTRLRFLVRSWGHMVKFKQVPLYYALAFRRFSAVHTHRPQSQDPLRSVRDGLTRTGRPAPASRHVRAAAFPLRAASINPAAPRLLTKSRLFSRPELGPWLPRSRDESTSQLESSERWEGSRAARRSVSRRGHGPPRRTRSWSPSSSPMAIAAGGSSPSLQVSNWFIFSSSLLIFFLA